MRSMLIVPCLVLAAGCGGGDAAPAAQQAAANPQPATTPAPGGAPGVASDGAEQGPSPGALRRGELVYGRTCVTCHQQNGMGLPGTYPPLDSAIVAGDKQRLIRLVLHGLQGPIAVQGRRYNNVMTPWRSLSDSDISGVLTYVRTRFGGGASEVTPEEVAAERQTTAGRTTMYTAQELGIQ